MQNDELLRRNSFALLLVNAFSTSKPSFFKNFQWRHVIKAKALFKLGLSSFVNGSSMIYNIPGPGQTFFLIWKTIFGEAMVCWNDQLHGIGIGASNAQFFGSHQSVFGCKRYQSSFTSIFRPTNGSLHTKYRFLLSLPSIHLK